MQMPSCRHWVSFRCSGIEYHQSHHLYLFLISVTLNMKIKSRCNQLIHQFFYGPSLARSKSLVLHHLTLTLRKILLRCYSLSLMNWKASDVILNTIRIKCFCFSAREEKLDILTIPLSPNFNPSFSKFLNSEILDADNKWFCPSCNCLTESTTETSVVSSGSILVIQLRRFSTSYSGLIKHQQVFNCSPELDLKIPITVEDEVSFSSKCCLMASINRSGTLDQGHYWAIVKDLSLGDWLSCNDKVVLTVPQHSLNNTTSYILFYKKN